MSKIQHIGSGVDVSGLLFALQNNPQLWNQKKNRTESPDSPHHGLDDIWLRYAPDGVDGSQPHDSVWHDCANVLPVKELVMRLFAAVGGTRLGGVLITRIPAGKECRPHKDPGWHARYYEKYAVQIQSAPGQAFCFEGESLEPVPGDIFWFDNSFAHWVTNPTKHDRITLIVCVNKE